MGSLFGGGGTQQTTQETSYAPWISGAQQGALGIALGQNLANLRAPGYSHAGLNLDQQKSYDLFRGIVNDVESGGRTMVPGMGGQNFVPASMQSATSNAAKATAQQLGPTDYQPFMDPYIGSVVNSTADIARRERDNSLAASSAKYAGRSGAPGSGEALEAAQIMRGFNESMPQLNAQLMSQGFNTAQGLAGSNVDRRQQTELSNAGFQQQTNEANADRLQQMYGTNAGYRQQAGMSGLDNLYRMLALEDQFKNSYLDRQQGAAAGLRSVGGEQQQDMQSILNMPYDALARIFQYVPQVYDQRSVGTQPDNSPSLFQQLLGAGLTIGGMPASGGGTLLGNWFS